MPEGATHETECSTPECSVWTPIWVPKKIPRGFLDQKFLCGFCAAKAQGQLEELTSEVEELKDALKKALETTLSLPRTGQRSYAAATKSDLASLARDIRKEQEQQVQRERNIIIDGTKPNASEEEELDMVREIADTIGISLDGVQLAAARIGTPRDNGKQLLRVSMTTEKKRELLSKARDLAKGPFNEVFFRPDRTPAEQYADYELRQALKKKRVEEPGKSWMIRRGKVTEKINPAGNENGQ